MIEVQEMFALVAVCNRPGAINAEGRECLFRCPQASMKPAIFQALFHAATVGAGSAPERSCSGSDHPRPAGEIPPQPFALSGSQSGVTEEALHGFGLICSGLKQHNGTLLQQLP
jgi:hypothetical protein